MVKMNCGSPDLRDEQNDALITMDALNNRVHRGEIFATGGVSSSIAKDSSYVVYFKTGSDGCYHVRTRVFSTDPFVYQIRERVTVSNNGTPVHIVNLNRNYSDTSDCISCHTPTISVAGSVLNGGYLGSSTEGGGGLLDIVETILEPSTGYTLTFTAVKNATYFTYQIVWWKHPT